MNVSVKYNVRRSGINQGRWSRWGFIRNFQSTETAEAAQEVNTTNQYRQNFKLHDKHHYKKHFSDPGYLAKKDLVVRTNDLASPPNNQISVPPSTNNVTVTENAHVSAPKNADDGNASSIPVSAPNNETCCKLIPIAIPARTFVRRPPPLHSYYQASHGIGDAMMISMSKSWSMGSSFCNKSQSSKTRSKLLQKTSTTISTTKKNEETQ